MAEQPQNTKVKVLRETHRFAGMDKDGNVEIPTRLVQTYTALGLIEAPKSVAKGAK